MELFKYAIDGIKDVKEGKRVVFATLDWSFYDGKHKDEKCAFLKSSWERIKSQKEFQENEKLEQSDGEYLESLPEDEWCKRFERDIKKISDEELVNELNRRTKYRSLSKIDFKIVAIVKE